MVWEGKGVENVRGVKKTRYMFTTFVIDVLLLLRGGWICVRDIRGMRRACDTRTRKNVRARNHIAEPVEVLARFCFVVGACTKKEEKI